MTRRCRLEDLAKAAEGPLDEMAGEEIIRALVHKHDATPETAATVGPSAGDQTLGVLRYGDDHRGAIWLDRPNDTLWLCAYRFHRSGEPDDAFAYFDQLIADRRIYPTVEDRTWLFQDRAERMVDALPADAQQFRMALEADPGTELAGTIGGVSVRGVVIELEGIREMHVAITMRQGNVNLLLAILASLRPTSGGLGDWRTESALPTSGLDGSRVEVAHSCLLD